MSAAPPPPEPEDHGRSQLPLREALTFFVFQSLRLRLGRLVVVLLGIAFAIAFLTVLLGTETIMSGIDKLSAQPGNEAADAGRSFQRWWIVVALLIATAGITNAVLMSVTERVKEIGTLKCLGARALHIVQIFLFETILLGTLGGLAGGILGVAALAVLFGAQLGGDLALVFGWSDVFRLIGISVLIAQALSLVAAVIPVVFAARIDPAEAMRYEV
ncbi:MAG: FtsX-like permease family protein [Planctomycetes bacterium]|nr:FtsX-like permease family protein [Planctomycetota bacterium]